MNKKKRGVGHFLYVYLFIIGRASTRKSKKGVTAEAT